MGQYLNLAKQVIAGRERLAVKASPCDESDKSDQRVPQHNGLPRHEKPVSRQLQDGPSAHTDVMRRATPAVSPGGDAAIWRGWIKERAAILKHDAGKSHAEADRLAYEAGLARWQHENPPSHANQDRCAACGGWLLDDLLPLAERDAQGQTVWVHASGGCWREYVRNRRAEAEKALATAGIASRVGWSAS